MSDSAWYRWGGAGTASHLAWASKDGQQSSRQGRTGRRPEAEPGSWGWGKGCALIRMHPVEPSTDCLEELSYSIYAGVRSPGSYDQVYWDMQSEASEQCLMLPWGRLT